MAELDKESLEADCDFGNMRLGGASHRGAKVPISEHIPSGSGMSSMSGAPCVSSLPSSDGSSQLSGNSGSSPAEASSSRGSALACDSAAMTTLISPSTVSLKAVAFQKALQVYRCQTYAHSTNMIVHGEHIESTRKTERPLCRGVHRACTLHSWLLCT